ncbi:hypothetical protein BDV98DRAFT_275385 [Pterulicium gracile]|uniref:Uncharacterized protein n=1 Tax=Pterulicium gracile TaxID=1884261 RepID=A0A5C3Q4U2_9AGAR|nr:hypothetical protein BDV98DRAFT_275385 [Pterula gracilis]
MGPFPSVGTTPLRPRDLWSALMVTWTGQWWSGLGYGHGHSCPLSCTHIFGNLKNYPNKQDQHNCDAWFSKDRGLWKKYSQKPTAAYPQDIPEMRTL